MTSLKLECFQDHSLGASLVEPLTEEARLKARFEAGFAEGFAAALAERAAEQSRSSAAQLAALEEATLTYAEAQMHVLRGLRGFLQALFQKILPPLAQPILVAHLVEELMQTPALSGRKPFEIHVNPACKPMLSAELVAQTQFDLQLLEDPQVPIGGLRLNLANGERLIDPSELIHRAEQDIRLFFDLLPAETQIPRSRHG